MSAVFYSVPALDDLRAIVVSIADGNPDRATTFVDELHAVMQTAAERPASFPARFDLALGLRAARHGRYMVFFTWKAPPATPTESKLSGFCTVHAIWDRCFERQR